MVDQQNNDTAWGSTDFDRFLTALGIDPTSTARALVYAIDFAMRRNNQREAMDAARELAALASSRNADSEAMRILAMYERMTDDTDQAEPNHDGSDNDTAPRQGANPGRDQDDRPKNASANPAISKDHLKRTIQKMILCLRDGLEEQAWDIAMGMANDMIQAGLSKKSPEELADGLMVSAGKQMAQEDTAARQERPARRERPARTDAQQAQTGARLPIYILSDTAFQQATRDFLTARQAQDRSAGCRA